MSGTAGDVLVPPGTIGYLDAISAEGGEAVKLHVSSTAPTWRAELVRLYALEIPGFGVERRAEPVAGVDAIEREGIEQTTAIGSYGHAVPLPLDHLESPLTITVTICPTRPGAGPQAAIAQRDEAGAAGWSLGLSADGHPRLWCATDAGDLDLTTPEPLKQGCWYALTATIDAPSSRAALSVTPVGTFTSNRLATGRGEPHRTEAPLPGTPQAAAAPLLLAAAALDPNGQPIEGFDGKLEAPAISHIASWNASDQITRTGIDHPSLLTDSSAEERHFTLVNHPTRAVTSSTWDGQVDDFRFAPDQYAAVHFHRTDMTDCGWTPQAELTLPADLPSGAYAVHLTDPEGGEDLVPLVVRPPAGTATAPALLVLSTNSYLAYGNDHVGVDSPRTQVWNQMVPALDDWERFRDAHRELGLSLYEVHSDGAGVCHSSWRRPLLTLRPTVYDGDGPVWQFTGDMQIVDWLERTGRAVDVVSDRDVHEGGAELLSRYACVMTGTHPEYPSEQMLDAYEAYVAGGGRLMYMGGNGMYWVTGYDPDDPQVIEIRRWGGTQAWCAAPGEYHLSFTGRLGGPWRFGGRAPQKTFGVGFVAAGPPSASAGYLPVAAEGSPVAWALAGVEDADFGRYGTMGGAAGIEIDAVDPLLGTAAATQVIATSAGHSDDMLEARENFNMTSRILGGARNPRVHSDLVIVPRENGGAVFSTGSIGFSGSLSHDGWDNDVSRLLGNVFDRFVGGAPVLD
ncbi:MAG TPA: N,N-dimethylformamidase beta subunit family domain-containing protein [Solirubrobacterales bacterium]|nr:N,N-dimethylformamidase beta subunit family domain-containing protein [Solirubrobacterales bacterium]